MTGPHQTGSLTLPEPGSALKPADRPLVGTLINQACSEGRTVGSPHADFLWDLSLLDQVTSFHAPDMVFSAETGLALDKAKDLIEAERLWLPLDSPAGSELLLTDFLAQDRSLSWLSHRYGTLKDWVVSLVAINDAGHEIHTGAKLAKNAAGYQLAPLYIGAQMALGPVLEVSFRLLPMPTLATLVSWQADNPAALISASRQLNQLCYPSGRNVLWEGSRISRLDGQWRMEGWTRFPSEQVKHWTQQLDGAPDGTITELDVPPREGDTGSSEHEILIQVIPTRIPGLLDTLHPLNLDLLCYPGAGALLLGPVSIAEIDALQHHVLSPSVATGGVARALTTGVPLEIPPAAMVSAENAIMARIKHILDPDGVFGPFPEIS